MGWGGCLLLFSCGLRKTSSLVEADSRVSDGRCLSVPTTLSRAPFSREVKVAASSVAVSASSSGVGDRRSSSMTDTEPMLESDAAKKKEKAHKNIMLPCRSKQLEVKTIKDKGFQSQGQKFKAMQKVSV